MGHEPEGISAAAGIDPRVYRRPTSRSDDADLRARLKDLSSERRRFGYRRLHVLLRREGWQVNRKKLYRIYKEEGLTVRKRGGRKRALGTRASMAIPQGPNQRWSLDFVSDSLSCGRRFRILNVIIRPLSSNQWRTRAHLQPGVSGCRCRHVLLSNRTRHVFETEAGTEWKPSNEPT